MARPLAHRLPLLAVLLLPACAGEAQQTTGVVSDLAGRVCVQTAVDDGTCFTATPEQLAGLQLGTCVTVAFEAANGVLGRATEVRPAPTACAG